MRRLDLPHALTRALTHAGLSHTGPHLNRSPSIEGEAAPRRRASPGSTSAATLRRVAALGVAVAALGVAVGASAQAPERSPVEARVSPLGAADLKRGLLLDEATGLRDATGSAAWRQTLDAIRAEPGPVDADWHRPRPALGLSTLEVRDRIIVMEDDDGSLFERGFIGLGGNVALNEVARRVYAEFPDDFDFITIVIDWSVNGAFAFYLPLSNDTRGIGYRHFAEQDIFDETNGKLQGFIFMNNWRFYTRNGGDDLSRIVWLQEIGHRWGAFARYDKGDGVKDDHLGRDKSHWSYFMQSHNSALEGNDWNDNGDGSFSTFTNASRMTFSDLDLYMMGLAPPEQVPPFFVIRNAETGNLRDSNGGRIQPASPPETGGEIKTLRGDRVDITIDDVIRAEGQRLPTHVDSQKTWRMATVFITRSAANVNERDLLQIEGLIEQWERFFEEATREQMNLITVLDGDEAPSDLPFGAPCADSNECDPAVATVCLTTDEGRICSRRCFADAECGQGFCCDDPADTGSLFCHPDGGDPCPSITPEPEATPEPTPEAAPEPDGFVAEPEVTSASARDDGCATPPGSPTLPAPWLLLGLLALLRRPARP